MSEQVKDGGPAFPHQFENVEGARNWHQSRGLSLRDYFAGQALMGAFTDGDTDIHDDIMARRCYELADAMLAAREPKP